MSEARFDRVSNENNTAGPIISGITTFSGQNYFVPPKGTTAERPSNCPVGSIRFNTDSAKLEYFNGLQWLEMEAFNNELGVSGALGNRGVWEGGSTTSPVGDAIDYITISTLGNAQTFGTLSSARQAFRNACSSSTRGVFGGGYTSSGRTNQIEFITFSSTGNAQDFSDLLAVNTGVGALSSQTRGLFAGGDAPTSTNTIQYVTIASQGVNAQDFGDLTTTATELCGSSSTTRGLFSSGSIGIDYVTISTLGNALDFGALSALSNVFGSCSNATKALFAGGGFPTQLNNIEFVTIASTGNAQDFGDLTVARRRNPSCASSTRAVFGSGDQNPAGFGSTNVIDYVTIASTGNAFDFGDLTIARSLAGACSNGHGGL